MAPSSYLDSFHGGGGRAIDQGGSEKRKRRRALLRAARSGGGESETQCGKGGSLPACALGGRRGRGDASAVVLGIARRAARPACLSGSARTAPGLPSVTGGLGAGAGARAKAARRS